MVLLVLKLDALLLRPDGLAVRSVRAGVSRSEFGRERKLVKLTLGKRSDDHERVLNTVRVAADAEPPSGDTTGVANQRAKHHRDLDPEREQFRTEGFEVKLDRVGRVDQHILCLPCPRRIQARSGDMEVGLEARPGVFLIPERCLSNGALHVQPGLHLGRHR